MEYHVTRLAFVPPPLAPFSSSSGRGLTKERVRRSATVDHQGRAGRS